MAESPTPAGAPSPGAVPNQPAAPQSGTGPGQKPGETPAQAEARRLKFRIGGQEHEFSEDEVATNFEKGRNASKLLSKSDQFRQEGLKAKSYADGLLGRLKTDTLKVLREAGVDVRALSERTILDEIELEKMSPAERRAYDAEQKLKAFEEERKKSESEKQRADFEAKKAQHQDEFANLFMSTMEATGLPKASARFVAYRMAHLYAQNEEAGLESTPEEMAAHVMEGVRNEHKGVLSGLQGEALLEHLGADVVKAVLGAHLAKVRAKSNTPPPRAPQRPTAGPAPKQADPRKGRWADIERLIKG